MRQETVAQIGQCEAKAIREHHHYVNGRRKRHHSAILDRERGGLHRQDEGNTDNDSVCSSEPQQEQRRQPCRERDGVLSVGKRQKNDRDN